MVKAPQQSMIAGILHVSRARRKISPVFGANTFPDPRTDGLEDDERDVEQTDRVIERFSRNSNVCCESVCFRVSDVSYNQTV